MLFRGLKNISKLPEKRYAHGPFSLFYQEAFSKMLPEDTGVYSDWVVGTL